MILSAPLVKTESITQPTNGQLNGGKGPLPLVLGITGHRDLRPEDEEPLRERVQQIFSELQESYRSTPLRVISGLAEGADRLVAQVALANNVELLACLPMQRSFYERDFETGESRREFDDLLKQTVDKIELPLAEGNTEKNIATEEARKKQYSALGQYLVDHCHILIALWDGKDSGLDGGASWVVNLQLGKLQPPKLQRRGEADDEGLLDPPDAGPVYHIVTPRLTSIATVGRPYDRHELYHNDLEPPAAAKKHYARIFRRMDVFNEDFLANSNDIEAGLTQSKDWLVPEAIRIELPDSLQPLIEHYAQADTLAIFYQKLTTRSMWLLFRVYAVLAVLVFVLFTELPVRSKPWALLCYLVIVAVAFWTYKSANARELKVRYLDYRALAEGLRVQLFWKLAGVSENVAQHYLSKLKTELDWIRNAIRAWTATLPTSRITPNLRIVQECWVNDQLKFFRKASDRDFRHRKREWIWTKVPLIAVVVISVALLVIGFASLNDGSSEWLGRVYSAGTILMVILPAIGGAYLAYSAKMAFNEQWKQYVRMRQLYELASNRLHQAIAEPNEKAVPKVIRALGREALEENGDWVLLHREREFEIRLGG